MSWNYCADHDEAFILELEKCPECKKICLCGTLYKNEMEEESGFCGECI